MAPIPTVTLDTNIFMEFWNDGDKAVVVEALLNLAASAQVDLAITNRVGEDVPLPPLAERINDLPKLNVEQIGSVFRLGHSALDGGDMFGSDSFLDVIDVLEDKMDLEGRVKKRPDWRDWDHLHGHYLTGRDTFLTWDRPILDVASELLSRLGIVVMKPEKFLSQLADPQLDSP